jgi:hypothetical protein
VAGISTKQRAQLPDRLDGYPSDVRSKDVATSGYFPEAQDQEEVRNFLKGYGVRDGEWMLASKDGWRVLMRPGFDWMVRLYACLQLHSLGYQGELVVRQVRGHGIVPLTPSAIASEMQAEALEQLKKSGQKPRILLTPEDVEKLGRELAEKGRKMTDADMDAAGRQKCRLSGSHTRRLMEKADLHDGFMTRVRANCIPSKLPKSFAEAVKKGMVTPLSLFDKESPVLKKLNGKIFLYFHIHSRPASIEALLRRGTEEDDQPVAKAKAATKHQQPTQRSFDFMLQDTEFKKAYTKASEKAPELAAQVMSELEAEITALRTRTTARLVEIGSEPEAPTSTQEALFTPPPAQPSASLNSNGSAGTPPPGVQGSRIAERRDAETPLVSQPRPKGSEFIVRDADAHQVLDRMRKFSAADLDAARDLIVACRRHRRDATIVQILDAIDSKGSLTRGKDNPVGFLLTAVPRMFEGPQPQRVQPASETVKCASCGKPIEPGQASIRGNCGDCYIASQQRLAASGD